MLHKSPEFEAAGFGLLVSEANWIAQQLGLSERVVMQSPAPEEWSIATSHPRVTGSVCSANYRFDFLQGALRGISKIKWMERISPPVRDWADLAGRSSLIDASGVRGLGIEWLQRLGVAMEVLEQQFPLSVSQAKIRKEDGIASGQSERVPAPFFILHWGRPPGVPISMQILGTTKELIGLEINGPALWTRPRLELMNADELLGAPPPPREFVERRLGTESFQIIERAEAVEVWLLTSDAEDRRPKRERAGPVRLKGEQAKAFSEVLLDFDSYMWDCKKMCIPDYGARLRFHKGSEYVDCAICYECDMVEIAYGEHSKVHDLTGGRIHNSLVRAIQRVFPDDRVVRDLKVYPERK
jgi:hypothetical protein